MRKLTYLLAMLAFFMAAATLVETNLLADGGGQLTQLDRRYRRLQGEVGLLERTVMEARSLVLIRKKAEALGFVDRPERQVITPHILAQE